MIGPPREKKLPGISIWGSVSSQNGTCNDPFAVHVNVANEFFPIPFKTDLDDQDLFLIENWADDEAKAKVPFSSINIDTIGDGVDFKKYLTLERIKLEYIEPYADVTDVANVTAALNAIPVSAHLDITSPGADIEGAVTLRHAQNTDTAIGPMDSDIDMNYHRIQSLPTAVNLLDAINLEQAQQIVGNVFHTDEGAEISSLMPIGAALNDNDQLVLEHYDDPVNPTWPKRSVTVSALKGSNDTTAIHRDIAAEIIVTPFEDTPTLDDIVLIESAKPDIGSATWDKKHVTLRQLTGTDPTAVHIYGINEIVLMETAAEMELGDIIPVEHLVETNPGETEWQKRKYFLRDLRIPNIDDEAVHYYVADEFHSFVLEKPTPIAADRILIEDSESSPDVFAKKFIEIGNIPVTSHDPTAVHVDGVNEFDALIHDISPGPDDVFIIEKGYSSGDPGKKRAIHFSSIPTAHDPEAWHTDGVDELSTVVEKRLELDADWLMLEQNADGTHRKVQISQLPTTGGGEVNFGENVGVWGGNPIGIYHEKFGSALRFKRLNTFPNFMMLDLVDKEGTDGEPFIDFKFNASGFRLAMAANITLRDFPDDPDTYAKNNRFVKVTQEQLDKIKGIHEDLPDSNAAAIGIIIGIMALNGITPWSFHSSKIAANQTAAALAIATAEAAERTANDVNDRVTNDVMPIIDHVVNEGKFGSRSRSNRVGAYLLDDNRNQNGNYIYHFKLAPDIAQLDYLDIERRGEEEHDDIINVKLQNLVYTGTQHDPDVGDATKAEIYTGVSHDVDNHLISLEFNQLAVQKPFKIEEKQDLHNNPYTEISPTWWLENKPYNIGKDLSLVVTKNIMIPVEDLSNGMQFFKIGTATNAIDPHLADRMLVEFLDFPDDLNKKYLSLTPLKAHLLNSGESPEAIEILYAKDVTDRAGGFLERWFFRKINRGTGINLTVEADQSLTISAVPEGSYIDSAGVGTPVFYGFDQERRKYIFGRLRGDDPPWNGIAIFHNEINQSIEFTLLFGVVKPVSSEFEFPWAIDLVLPQVPGDNAQFVSSLFSDNGLIFPFYNRIKFSKERVGPEAHYATGLRPVMTVVESYPLHENGFHIFSGVVNEEEMLHMYTFANLYAGNGITLTNPFELPDPSIEISMSIQNYPEAPRAYRILDDNNVNWPEDLYMRRLLNCAPTGNQNYDFITTLWDAEEEYKQILVRGMWSRPDGLYSTTWGQFSCFAPPGNRVNKRYSVRDLEFNWEAPYNSQYNLPHFRNPFTRFIDIANYTQGGRTPLYSLKFTIPSIKRMKQFYDEIKDKFPHIQKYKASETTRTVFWGTYFTDAAFPAETSTVLFREIDIFNATEDNILAMTVASNFFDDDTLRIDLDPHEIRRLGVQAEPLDMGNQKITNVADADIITPVNTDVVNVGSLIQYYNTHGEKDLKAIHTDEADEIGGLWPKATLVDDDLFIIEDSQAAGGKKSVTASQFYDNTAIHRTRAQEFDSIDPKGDPKGADLLVIEDSEDVGKKKRVLLSDLPYPPPGLGPIPIIQYNAQDGAMDLTEFFTFYQINTLTVNGDIFLPIITPSNNGKYFWIKLLAEGGGTPRRLRLYSESGNTINQAGDIFATIATNQVLMFMADEYTQNWVIIGSSAMSSDAIIASENDSSPWQMSQYSDNALAVAGGLKNGALYRTGDVLKVVHDAPI